MKRTSLLLTILSLLILSVSVNAQPLTGTKNIPGDYATIAAAVADLNANGVGSGGVTFNVAAGHTETISATIVLTATGTASDPIVFQKSGAGANPLITAYTGTSTPGSATQDGIWALVGSDYVTIDGIDLTDPNSSNPATMEYGYGLFKASVTNGCQNVTIQNCTITLNRVNNATGSGPAFDGSRGIEVVNATRTAHTTALTPTSAAGSNSNNKFYSNTIQNCNIGIGINGFAATSGVGPSPDPATFLGDLNNDIGGTSSSTGNTILNYGGGGATSPAAGIRANNQWSVNISYNTINNNDGSGVNHTTTLRGIFAQAGTSANATITYNNITIKGGGTTSQVAAIENGIGSTAAGNTVNINNNTITGDYLTATSGAFYGIYSTASAATVNINNNTVQNLSYSAVTLTGTGAVYPIWNSGAATTVNANNNTVNNITRTGTTGGTTIGIYISSGTTQNVNGNTITNMSIDGSGSSSTMYGIQTATGTINVNNNNISNLQCIKTSGTSPLYGIYNIASPTNETINNNNVNNLTHNGTGVVYGIYHWTTTGTRTMSGNTVHTITGAGTTIAGINNASSSPSVFRNNVYNISSTSTGSATVSGIIQGSLGTSGVAYIYNNFVSDIKAPNANNATAAVRGINITTTTTTTNIYLYYNTVYLNATSTGANFGTAALFVTASATATTANLTMLNNIFVNSSTANGTGFTVAYQRSSTDLANYNSASNNNLFYAGTPSTTNLIFRDGTNNDQTLSAYKTRVAPRDANSVTENPPFVNVTTTPYDLHIDPSTATQVESGGIRITSPIAITTDYDNDTRALETGYLGTGTAPDIGADEGEFTLADFSPPVISYTLLSNTASTSNRTFSGVSITDATGVEFTAGLAPRVYFKKKTDANTFAGNTSGDNGWKYVETNDVTSPVSFTIDYSLLQSAVVAGDTIQYFVVAQDLSTYGPFVGINSGVFTSTPASVDLNASHFPITGTINSYAIVPSISGPVTVGTGGTYTTLTGAGGLFADINSKVVTGDITATIISDLTETGANALNQMAVEGGSWTLTIAPDAATERNITGSYAGGLIRLNGADRVIIDGRYSGSGNFLTFSNTATSGTIAAIQLISLGTGQGCENVTIRNCNISTGFNGATSYGIFAGASSIGTAGDDHDNLTITENNIQKAYYGLRIMSNSTGKSDNVTVTKNSIGSNTIADYIGKYGMELIQINNSTIAENTIFNIKTSNTNLFGISIGTGVTNTTISRNLIYGLNYTGTSGYGGKGIDINTGVASSNLTVVNNVIYDIGGDGWSILTSDANVGIRVLGTSGGINIYYNSVNLYGTWNRSATATLSAALYVPSGVTNIDVRNNVFSNSIVNASNTGAKAYAIYNAGTSGVFSTINYNDYFASGTQGVLGYLTSDRADLSAWQNATGQDGNSISANPQFNSNTNLQPQLGSPVLGAGTPITGITTDYLGVSRSATNPSIGAYEEGLDGTGPTITYTALGNINSVANRTLSGVTITDASGVDFGSNKPRIYYKKSTDANVFGGNTSTDNGWKWTETSSGSSPADFTIDYSIINGGSVSVGDTIQYFVVAQDLFTTPNVSSNPSTGFVGTSVSSITTAPTTLNKYKIVNNPLSGDYTVGSSFKKITGLDITFEKQVVVTQKQVKVNKLNSIEGRVNDVEEVEGTIVNNREKQSQSSQIVESLSSYEAEGELMLVDVEEEVYIPMLNGIPYEGPLYVKKSENPNLPFPMGIEGIYLTLTAAIADLNERGLDGPVRFLLEDGTYPSETLPLWINIQSSYLPTASNTVTIKPMNSVTSTISGSINSNAIFRISNSHIIIDGSNTDGGTTRDLTIQNNSATSPQVIRIGSIGTNSVTGVVVKNCNITNGAQTSSAVIVQSTDPSESTEGYFTNVSIVNNSIKKAYIGVYCLAVVQAGNGNGLLISENDLNSSGANALRRGGIYVQGVDGFTISRNEVANFSSTESEDDFGIWAATGSINGLIERNRVHNIAYTGTSGYGAWGIALSSGSSSANLLVRNNLIYNIRGDGYDITSGSFWTDNPFAILASGSQGGLKIYNNSINLYGNTLNQDNAMSVGIMLGTGSNADIRNNSVVNNLGLFSGTGIGSAAVFAQGSNAQFVNINYNNYYVNPIGSGVKAIGRIGTTNYTTLSAWKTASAQDAYSYSGDPAYTANDNLLPDGSNANSWILNGKGLPLSDVPNDYAGNSRSTSVASGPTDIGAYEFNTTVNPPVASPSAPPSPSSTTTYSVAGNTVTSIAWGSGGTVPTSVNVQYYSGTPAPYSGTKPRINAYWDINQTGGSGFTYDITLTYDEAQLGSINENNLIPAKSDDGGTTWTPYTTVGTNPGEFQRNTAANTITLYGMTSFSFFTLGDEGDPLPVQLSSFTASVSNRDITLNWKTETEVNSAKFVVERKHKDNDWTTLAEVKASGNSNSPKEYSYLDKKLNSGAYQYRLKMIDNDGTYSYSDVVEGNVELPKEYGISQNYPNPFNPTTKIDYQLPFDSKVMVELYSITGEKVAEIFNGINEAGYYTLDVNGSSLRLASGVYIYRILATNLSNGQVYMNVKKMMMLK